MDAAGGTLASLIQPSAILVIYAVIIVGWAMLRPGVGPPVGGFSWGERITSLRGLPPILAVAAIIISALYEGWATPTESGAPGAFGMSGAQCSVWFGIIVVKMAEVCLITPPIGLNCFVVNGVRPDIPLSDVFRGIALFFVADVVTISRLAPVGQQLILCHVAERALGQPKSC